MRLLRTALFAIGYPVALVVIARFVPVVRERRANWLAAHHVAVAAIVAGWLARGKAAPAALNAGWLAASSVWYARGGRDRRR